MKKNIRHLKWVISSIGALLFSNPTLAQHNCGYHDTISENRAAHICGTDSDFIPDDDSPIYTIRMKYHILQKNQSSPENFEDNQATYNYFNQQVNWINDIFSTLVNPTRPVLPSNEELQDSKIRFSLNQSDIVFHIDEQGWNRREYLYSNDYTITGVGSIDPQTSLQSVTVAGHLNYANFLANYQVIFDNGSTLTMDDSTRYRYNYNATTGLGTFFIANPNGININASTLKFTRYIDRNQHNDNYLNYAVEDTNYFHVFITGSDDPNYTIPFGAAPSFTQEQGWINLTNLANGGAWANAQLTAHEIGHAFGLKHTNIGNNNGLAQQFPDLPATDHFAFEPCNTTNISNNIMGYNMCRNYFSPLQIAYMRQTISSDFSKFLQRSVDCSENLHDDVIITSDKVWNHNESLSGNLIISSGNTLTIKCRVNMPPNSKIIIERGAKLIADGAVITNECGYMWQGIEVHGNRNKKQYNYEQGTVDIKNSTISNALEAISTYKKLENGWDWEYTGGIIVAQNSTFLNNKRNIQFLSYHAMHSTTNNTYEINNKSRINACDFKIDNDYLGSEPFPHITMWDVDGINFINNLFEDTRSISRKYKRDGIHSIDAAYNINSNTFTSLDYGIKAIETDDFFGLTFGKYIKIFNSDFDCLSNIYMLGLNKSKITDNNINNNHVYNSNSGTQYGVYLESCSNYQVESNILTCNTVSRPTFGFLVSNHSGDNTMINNNKINKYRVAIEAIDQNRPSTFTTTNNAGFEARCNEFTNSKYDIYIADGMNVNVPVRGISKYQGNPTEQLADNLFANSSTFLTSNMINDNDYITYFHHPVIQNNLLKPILYDSNSITLNQPTSSLYTNYTNNCDLNNDITIGLVNFQQLLDSKVIIVTNLNDAKTFYYDLIDGGETYQLETDIKESVESDAYIYYIELMNKAGELSEEVLLEVAKKEEGFTVAMIRNILVANPLAAKLKELDEILDNRVNQLPLYMRNQIKVGKTALSTKEFLELEITKYKRELSNLIHKGLGNLDSNPNINITKEMSLELLSNTNVLEHEINKLLIYMSSNDNSYFNNQFEYILSTFKLITQQEEYLNDLKQFFNLKKNWSTNNITINNLPESELSTLNYFVNKNSLISASAMAILELNKALDYTEPVYLPNIENKSLQTYSNSEKVNADIMIYPNPATDFFSLRYKIEEEFENFKLEIINIEGKSVYTKNIIDSQDELIIETRDLKIAEYFVVLSLDEKVFKTIKFVKK